MEKEIKKRKAEGILKKWLLFIIDIALFTFCNIVILYITNGGSIDKSPYLNVLFNAYHMIALCVLVGVVNYFFRLYKSIWAFAGTTEIVSCA